MTKALQAAITRRDAMIRTGASPESIAVMDARIERLTKKAGTCTTAAKPAIDPMDEYHRIMGERLAMLDRRRAKIAELEAELESEKALLDAEIDAVLNTAPRDELVVKTPVAPSAETTVKTEDTEDLVSDETEINDPVEVSTMTEQVEVSTMTTSDTNTFDSYEPTHVAAVAAGAPARFVAGPDNAWFIAARTDQIDAATGEVVVERRDGSVCVPVVGDVVAAVGSVAVYTVWRAAAVAA